MEFIYIIIIIIIFLNFYLLYRIKNLENKSLDKFETLDDSMQKAVVEQYKSDINDISTIANIYNNIAHNSNSNIVSLFGNDLLLIFNETQYGSLNIKNELKCNDTLNSSVLNTKDLDANHTYNIFPLRSIVPYNNTNFPPGWVLCDGKSYKMDEQNNPVVSNDADAIKTPDLRGRFIVGGLSLTLNETGGQDKVVLDITQIPYHDHTRVPLTGMGPGGDIGTQNPKELYSSAAITHYAWTDASYVDTSETGNNAPHNNMPPYYVLYYIMKVAY